MQTQDSVQFFNSFCATNSPKESTACTSAELIAVKHYNALRSTSYVVRTTRYDLLATKYALRAMVVVFHRNFIVKLGREGNLNRFRVGHVTCLIVSYTYSHILMKIYMCFMVFSFFTSLTFCLCCHTVIRVLIRTILGC